MSEMESELLEDVEDTLVRIKRLEISLNDNIQAFVKAQNKLSVNNRELTLEIETIKVLRASISETISKAVEVKMDQIMPEILPSIITGFNDSTKELVAASLEKIKNAGGLAQEIIVNANNVMLSFKRELTMRRIWLSGVFCLSSILTAGVIFYFFPQHVHKGFTDDFLQTYFVGKAVRDNFEGLSPKDKKFIEEKFRKIYS